MPTLMYPRSRDGITAAPPLSLRLASAAALGMLLAACSSAPPPTYDLTAPRVDLRGGTAGRQIVVAEPITVQVFESERIIVKDRSGAVSFLGNGQWADRLPRLIQERLIQTFENASRLKAVSRPGDRIAADYRLTTDIRSFQIDAARGEAVVEISAKLVNDREGKIVNGRIFSARVPVSAIDAATAAQALDRALTTVLIDIVRWTGGSGGQVASAR